jgi:hypothetical protein
VATRVGEDSVDSQLFDTGVFELISLSLIFAPPCIMIVNSIVSCLGKRAGTGVGATPQRPIESMNEIVRKIL